MSAAEIAVDHLMKMRKEIFWGIHRYEKPIGIKDSLRKEIDLIDKQIAEFVLMDSKKEQG
jgi:hypothetical protein